MLRRNSSALCAILLLAAARPAEAFLYVRGTGSGQNSGDLVAVWVKNSFEMIVNLGPIESLHEGVVASFPVPSQFGSDLSGAKFTALAVPNPEREFDQCGFDPAPEAYNIGFTSNQDPNLITWDQVGNAQSALDTPDAGQAWLLNLNNIPASGDPNVIENSEGDALISISQSESYTGNVGYGSDAIANNIAISTAVTIDPLSTGKPYSIALYEVFETLSCSELTFGTQIIPLGYLNGTSGSTGPAQLVLGAPEPTASGLAATAVAALAWIGRRRCAGPRGRS